MFTEIKDVMSVQKLIKSKTVKGDHYLLLELNMPQLGINWFLIIVHDFKYYQISNLINNYRKCMDLKSLMIKMYNWHSLYFLVFYQQNKVI